ncbi:MAG: tRNA-dihydrouridine synthase family protein [Pseudobdellovibrionaceae bacterium]
MTKPELQRPILHGKVNFPLCLAPMVGLTHVALRLVIRDYLPDGAFTIWPTEMLNSRRVPDEDLSKTPEAMRSPLEQGLVPQILGNDEHFISRSVRKLTDWGAEGIDINMGCPVQKALKHNYGVALMGDPDYAADVVRMTVRHSAVPVSVKLRAGTQSDFDYLVNFVRGLSQAGASWISLHPRTAAQKRRGVADWEQIRRLRERVDFPVVGNGDIQTADDVFLMLSQTGCDLTMAGRALAARPWMLWQVGERLGFSLPFGAEEKNLGVSVNGNRPRAPQTFEEEGAEYGKCLLKLLSHSRQFFGDDLALRKVRFYIRTTSVWLVFGHSLISVSTKAKTCDELEQGIRSFFTGSIEMVPRTQLRE